MPLNSKGEKIKSAMEREYGAEKGKKVFYASENKGTIKGVKAKKEKVASKMHEQLSKKATREMLKVKHVKRGEPK